MRRLLGIVMLLAFAGCSKPGTGIEMQAARALELRRNEEAYRLLEPLVGAAIDSADAAALAPTDRLHRGRRETLYARACLRTGRTMRGVHAAARAVALEPLDPEAHRVKALLDQRRFRNVAAVAAAEEAARLAPDDVPTRLVLGETKLGGGMVGTPDFAGAQAAFRAALERDPANLRARFGLAKALVSAGASPEGEALLDSLLADGRAPAEARHLRGLARLRRRDLAGADRDFRDVCRMEPTRSAAWFNWARVLEMDGRSAEAEETRRRFAAAQEFESALRPLEVALHSSQDNLGAALEWSALLLRAGRGAEAIPILETASSDHPAEPRAPALLAAAATGAGDAERAAAAGREATRRSPDDPRAHVALSNALALGAGGEEALAAARRAVELAPNSAEAHATLGRRLLEAGDAAAAVRSLQTARRIAPEDATLLAEIGAALAAAGAPEEAEQALGAAMARLGARATWLTARGRARAAMGRPGRAAEDFRFALAADAGDTAAARGLADALRAQGRAAEADSAARAGAQIVKFAKDTAKLRAALARDPQDVDRAEHLARELRQAGREDEANDVLARAYALSVEP